MSTKPCYVSVGGWALVAITELTKCRVGARSAIRAPSLLRAVKARAFGVRLRPAPRCRLRIRLGGSRDLLRYRAMGTPGNTRLRNCGQISLISGLFLIQTSTSYTNKQAFR